MRKVYFFIIASMFSCCVFAQYNWQALPNAPISWRLDDCYFLNSRLGWAISPYYDYLFPNKFGQICRTTDGGNTWQIQKDSSQTFFRSIGFADSLTGWVGNLGDSYDSIPLYHTIDGVTTWLPVTNIPNPQPGGICGISVVTDSVIYAYGRFYGPPILLKTIDKGNTWTSQNMSLYARGLIDGYFFNKDTGFVTGSDSNYNATIISTYDGGITWQVRYLSTRNDTDGVWKLSFPTRNIGYASVEYWGSIYPHATHYLKTMDGGLTWNEYSFISGYDLQGIGFINDTVGWIGGDFNYRTYKTTDGGTTWNPDFGFGVATPPYASSTGYVMNRFRRFGDTLMYASGNTVYKLDLTGTGINEMQNENNSITNYPNPFSNETTISYQLGESSKNVMLEIYSVLGEKIVEQNLGTQNSGEHQFVYSTELPSGIYYCTISTEKNRATQKIVVEK
ncbi:MAG TPA: T9SS type A sorting domain-containing protein [Bacteroidia bacterium]|nr:T9SS type A sorting domain-containing protein [Bacteroidia bacterium]